MKTYKQEEILILLHSLSGWTYREDKICKTLVFKDFQEAFAFMTRVAELAEEANHHPDWRNVYNKVEIHLSTHEAMGITDKDLDLARKIDLLLKHNSST